MNQPEKMITPDDVCRHLQTHPNVALRAEIRQYQALATARQYRKPYRVVQQHLPQGSRVLDWGCGNGHFSQFLLKAGYRVDAYAFGLPEPLVRQLLHDHPDRIRYAVGSEADPVKIPYADAMFDAVTSMGVLEHVRETGGDEIASLREIRRILKPGGQFFCFHFPNRWSWIEGMTRLFPSRHHHRYRYTTRDIRRLAHVAQFDVVTSFRYNAIPRNAFVDLSRRWPIAASGGAAAGADLADGLFSWVLHPWLQNYGFVLQAKTRTC